MKSYLYVMVENIPVLIDGDEVYEILSLKDGQLYENENSDSAAGHVDWRDQLLLTVNARALLEMPYADSTGMEAGIVYRIKLDQPPIFLIVDEVVQILELNLESFVSLPHVPEKIRYLFDKVYMDANENRHAYRFRNPLPDNFLTDVALTANS